MGKKIKYNFKLKLKILKFFNLQGVMPPLTNFSPKMDNFGGGITPKNTVIIFLFI